MHGKAIRQRCTQFIAWLTFVGFPTALAIDVSAEVRQSQQQHPLELENTPIEAGEPSFVEPAKGGFVEPKGPNQASWYLGVFGNYTSTGHLLTQVYPNTPAARAGLEPGDRILTVNGQQVGDVLGRQYPIDMLLQKHASPSGHVRLLVQDRRTRLLVNFEVRLVRQQVHF
jgi:predicted metalloprotease with PDZ domain